MLGEFTKMVISNFFTQNLVWINGETSATGRELSFNFNLKFISTNVLS